MRKCATTTALVDREFRIRQRQPLPHEFVLDALAEAQPRTHPMFGCLAVYVGEKIMLILRDKREPAADNGVWLATIPDHHASLRTDFPSMPQLSCSENKSQDGRCFPQMPPTLKNQRCEPASSFLRKTRVSGKCLE